MEHEEMIARWLDGDLTDDELAALERRAAADPALRDLMRAEAALGRDLEALRELRAPDDLLDGVMAQIGDRPGWRASVGAWIRARVALPLPAWGLGAAAVLALGFGLGRTTAPSPAPAAPVAPSLAVVPAAPAVVASPAPSEQVADRDAEPREVLVRFVYAADEAHSVAIAGDFNSWEPVPMTRVEGAGAWTATVAVPAGTHEYTFVVDGQRFVPDPLAGRYRDDGFGNKNALIELAQVTDL